MLCVGTYVLIVSDMTEPPFCDKSLPKCYCKVRMHYNYYYMIIYYYCTYPLQLLLYDNLLLLTYGKHAQLQGDNLLYY